ncbi:hypothetical protein QEN19_002609 [Hanseniaspora menglaensis]
MVRQTIIIDNSEYSRNGDFQPNRYQQEIDCSDYFVRNLKNNSGNAHTAIIAGAGDNPYVVLADAETSAIYHEKLFIKGKFNILTSIEISLLTSPEEIILFHCSPITDSLKQDPEYKNKLTKLLKKLKKNNISLEIINFGEIDTNTDFWESIIQETGANGSDLIKLMNFMSEGGNLLWEQISDYKQRLIFNGNETGNNEFMEYGGIDPSMDPELAMALRMSLEEEQQRQARVREESS